MYGTVTLVDDTILTIQSNAEFQSLNGSSSTAWSANIDGTSVSNSNIKKVVVGSSVTSIPSYFLRSCSNLIELDLSGATSLTTIGDYFLYYCTALNAPINIPEGVTTIGYTPLNNLTAFSSSITIPESITSFGSNSLRNLDNFNGPLVMNTSNFDSDTTFQLTTQSSTTSAYVNGVKIRGKYASEYVNTLPDKNGPSTYRKLILDTSPIIYGSVNNQSETIKTLYGSVNGQTKKIKKLYGSVNGQTKLVYQA